MYRIGEKKNTLLAINEKILSLVNRIKTQLLYCQILSVKYVIIDNFVVKISKICHT